MALKMKVTGTLGYLTDRSLRWSVTREDQLLRQQFTTSDRLHYKDLVGHYGCVNAIEFSHGLGRYVASGNCLSELHLSFTENACLCPLLPD